MAEERKRLVLKEILTGAFESIYSPVGTTSFTVTLRSRWKSGAQIAWMRRQMPAWIVLLNEESGTIVESVKVSHKVSQKYSTESKIVAELVIEGGLKLNLIIDEELRQATSGQIKKLLAERIEENFPPPFDY